VGEVSSTTTGKIDIGGKRIHRLFLYDSGHETWPAPDFPTSIGLRGRRAVVGL
jgi:sugar lactone lactonase YvrE